MGKDKSQTEVERVETREPINWSNFFLCFALALGQIAFGYPASIISTTLGQPPFLIYMGLVTAEGTLSPKADQLIGLMSGIFQAGAVIGVLVMSSVADRWGRKGATYFCATLSIVSGILIAASQNVGMFIAFRFFAGAGSWGFLALTPLYTAELAPPKWRGFFVGMNGVLIGLGYAIAAYIGLAFYEGSLHGVPPAWEWRSPLVIAIFWPILMVLIVRFWAPESPRYLLLKGRTEEAWAVVSRIHYVKGDEDQEFARGEFYQMQQQVEYDRTLSPSWLQMFGKKSYRSRMYVALGFAFLGQSTAVLVINNYGPTFYKALGYGVREQLVFQCTWLTVSIPSNFIGAILMDRVGRKPLMLLGVAGSCACLIWEVAIVKNFVGGTNTVALKSGVAAFMVFLVFYSIGVDCAGVVFYGELFPNHMRAKGLSLSIAMVALTDLVYLQATTTAFTNIGWKFFLVFIIISGLGFIWACFYLPETRGIPLEEMAALFGDADEVMVYSKDIHIDRNTHQLVVEKHDGGDRVEAINEEALHHGKADLAHTENAV